MGLIDNQWLLNIFVKKRLDVNDFSDYSVMSGWLCSAHFVFYTACSTRPPIKVLILKALIVSSLTASWPSLATWILAARAPLELSSLVIALCDHQQKMRQHNTTMYIQQESVERIYSIIYILTFQAFLLLNSLELYLTPILDSHCLQGKDLFIFVHTSCSDDKPLAVRLFWWTFGSTNWYTSIELLRCS